MWLMSSEPVMTWSGLCLLAHHGLGQNRWRRNGTIARSFTTLQEFDCHSLDHGDLCFYRYLTNGRCPERNQPMTNIPAKLVAEFATISDRIEEAIRQDERHKLLQRMAADTKIERRDLRALILGIQRRKSFGSGGDFMPTSKLGKLYRCLA